MGIEPAPAAWFAVPMIRALLALALLATPCGAAPADPVHGPEIGTLEVGIFCALQAMDRMPAPGTASGWIHVPTTEIRFHWPDRQVVPAAIGLAFGVKALAAPGWSGAAVEARVTRPGRSRAETWETFISDSRESIAFFRFDSESELDPGLWTFEAWQGDARLYRVEFEVVPAAALPEIVEACGAVS